MFCLKRNYARDRALTVITDSFEWTARFAAIVHPLRREQGQPMQTDTRPTPEPLHIRKERQAAEGQAAWTHYRAEQDAVNKNMERLRAQRLAREAVLIPAAPRTAPKTKRKAKNAKVKSARPGEGSRAQNQADRP